MSFISKLRNVNEELAVFRTKSNQSDGKVAALEKSLRQSECRDSQLSEQLDQSSAALEAKEAELVGVITENTRLREELEKSESDLRKLSHTQQVKFYCIYRLTLHYMVLWRRLYTFDVWSVAHKMSIYSLLLLIMHTL